MGGAMAMLAALDLAHHKPHLRPVSTYPFAAPRVGDASFAAAFEASFSEASAHWALQAENDAVPHLPFAAWGFSHPEGVTNLDGAGLARTADPGDSVETLRPAMGKPEHWATCHDIELYVSKLREALAVARGERGGGGAAAAVA